MTPQQAVGLACRLFAVWLALGSFQGWMLVRAAQTQGIAQAEWVQYSVPGIYWLAAVLLWFFPMSIAHRLLPRTRFEDRMALPAQKVLVVACIVLGLLVLALRALPALVGWLSMATLWLANGQALAAMGPEGHVRLLEGLLQLAVAFAFVFKAHAIADRILPRPGREHASPSLLGESAF
ncbi:MAG TPA: hypothetical protein VEB23_07565 [Ramlibacter sp.]|nr:hypothetical protein [Ramlibacter sp.]